MDVTFDLNFFMLAIPAVLFASVSKAGFGGGAAFVSAAILALVIPPGLAIGIMLPLLMLVDVAAVGSFWGKWHWKSFIGVMIGGIPGMALGAWLFVAVDGDVFRTIIGAMCLAFVAYQGARAAGWLNIKKMGYSGPFAWIAGVVAGFTSFVAHAGGPPVAVFLLAQGMDKTKFQATTLLIFWAMNFIKFIPYAYLGIFTADTWLADLYLFPVALFGAWLGVYAHRLVSERFYFGLTYVLLVFTGIQLIRVALT